MLSALGLVIAFGVAALTQSNNGGPGPNPDPVVIPIDGGVSLLLARAWPTASSTCVHDAKNSKIFILTAFPGMVALAGRLPKVRFVPYLFGPCLLLCLSLLLLRHTTPAIGSSCTSCW